MSQFCQFMMSKGLRLGVANLIAIVVLARLGAWRFLGFAGIRVRPRF